MMTKHLIYKIFSKETLFFLLSFFLFTTGKSFAQTSLVSAETPVPAVLSDSDIERYKQIFALQEDAKWAQADKLIKGLDNNLLLGHIYYQRYMHPTGYRSKYSELARWMKNYADHPSAWRVYRLAKRRQGRARNPRRPEETRYPGVTGQSAAARPALPRRSKEERSSVSRFKANVRRYVRRGQPQRAEKRYWAMEARDLLAPHEKAASLERIAASYYYKGNDFKALIMAKLAGDYARIYEPEADWIAGLANWRMGSIDAAYEHFTLLSEAERASDFLLAAGHFWASRAAYRLNKPIEAKQALLNASGYNETFYGLIAGRQLGIKPNIDWAPPALDDGIVNRLLKETATLRAIALIQLDRDDLAEEELRLLWGREGTTVQADLIAFTAHLNLPGIQTRLGYAGGTGDVVPATVRYPIPNWQPADGFRLDRAVIFAVVRQESDFRLRAKSRVGAGGLMQLMPATARQLSRTSRLLRRNRHRLNEPEFNMAFGQRYIEQLHGFEFVDANLFMLLAAYNAGPGSLLEWRQDVNYEEDPLLFIESIGFYETRNFIERVMRNLWLYRIQLGQDTPSLDAVASGAWPTLEFIDTPETIQAIRSPKNLLRNRKTGLAED